MSSDSLHKEWIDLALKSCIELRLGSDCVASCCQYLHSIWNYIQTTNADKPEFETGNVVSSAILIGNFFSYIFLDLNLL